jgi:hypothetical protein
MAREGRVNELNDSVRSYHESRHTNDDLTNSE